MNIAPKNWFVIIHLSPLIFPAGVLDGFVSIKRKGSAEKEKVHYKLLVFQFTFEYY